jgi:hypothetical protein
VGKYGRDRQATDNKENYDYTYFYYIISSEKLFLFWGAGAVFKA